VLTVAHAGFDRGWIQTVLFDHGIDTWVDLAEEPAHRPLIARAYADQIEAAFVAWRHLCAGEEASVEDPPGATDVAPPLRSLIQSRSWTELNAGLAVVSRALTAAFDGVVDAGASDGREFSRVRDKLTAQSNAALARLDYDNQDTADHLEWLLVASGGWVEAVAPSQGLAFWAWADEVFGDTPTIEVPTAPAATPSTRCATFAIDAAEHDQLARQVNDGLAIRADAMEQLEDLVYERRIDVLVVLSLSRLGGDLATQETFLAGCHDHGVRILCLDDPSLGASDPARQQMRSAISEVNDYGKIPWVP
jgi:hypothetical protein